MTSKAPKFEFEKIFVLGFGFLGITLLWSIYDDYVPILLQAGRPGFSKGTGVNGFGLSISQTGFIMGMDNFAALFILPYVGGFSDRLQSRWGRRKPFILIGAPIAAVAFAAAPFLLGQPLALFMGALIVTLLAMDLFRTPVVALMPDLTPPPLRSQANGIVNFMGGLGGVVAQQVGGTLFGVSPIAPFLLGAGGMLIAQAILVLMVREPSKRDLELRDGPPLEKPERTENGDVPDEEPQMSLGLLPSLWKVINAPDRSAALLLGAICFWFLGQSAWGTWFTSYAIDQVHQASGLPLTPGEAATLKTPFALSVLACAIPAGAVGGLIGRKKTILIGLVLLALSIGACFFIKDAVWMRPLLVSAGLGWMLVVVNSLPLVLEFAPPGQAGTYTGLYYLASQTASFIGPIISGRLFEFMGNNYHFLCVYTPVALLVAGLLVVGVRGGGKPVRAVPASQR